MSLVVENLSRIVDGQVHLQDISESFEPGGFNVLLGRTLAGKTSLLRAIAGLDPLTTGRIMFHGEDVTRLAVQKRNLSMVYQQFINYPTMTVAQNIASPLKLAGVTPAEVTRRVSHVAEIMGLQEMLDRYPLELSGGQQQRCALARALVKDAGLVLFDEPLVNLDYKLRESLRSELKAIFRERDTVAIYATTEASEALALGGKTLLLHEGRVLQSGDALSQYRKPVNLAAADLYHEPPLNRVTVEVKNEGIWLGEQPLPEQANMPRVPPGTYQLAVRSDQVSTTSTGTSELVLDVKVELAEIGASETYVHLKGESLQGVMQKSGVHPMPTDTPITVFIPMEKLFIFDQAGRAVHWPEAKAAKNG